MVRGQELHRYILEQTERALAGRPWSWLARQAGIPRSTLATQIAKPRFSIDVLLRIAAALERDVAFFLPEAAQPRPPHRRAAEQALQEIARIVERASPNGRP